MTQSGVFLKMTQELEAQENETQIVDDQTSDNELQYELANRIEIDSLLDTDELLTDNIKPVHPTISSLDLF